MHLSRLYIENFRSIRKLDLQFGKGKNVIIGRNNAGKSNVIRALDIVLGEGSPAYARSENVTLDDFFTWHTTDDGEEVTHIADDLVIWCELSRDDNELLSYDDIYKCFGFKVRARITGWEKHNGRNKPVTEPDRFPAASTPDRLRDLFAIDEDASDTDYINPKLRHQNTFESAFEPCFRFAFVFYAKRNEHGKIDKSIRFLYRENDAADWVLAFSAPVRTELIQSANIPSFRDPQSQLRLPDTLDR